MQISEMAAQLAQPHLQPPRKLYRIDAAGDRQYYYLQDDGTPVFFQSVTTAIRNGMPTSPHLIKWMGDMGTEAAEAYRDERAAFGTFMHITFEQYLLNKCYDLDNMQGELLNYLRLEALPETWANKWLLEQQKALLGFAAFVTEYKVKPLCIEVALASEEMQIAGMIDLVCEMTVPTKGYWGEEYKTGERKGQPKESTKDVTVTAIVDFKSGKNFYDDHAIQLDIYRQMWNENFPDHPVNRTFNWSPSDWRTAPTFKLKEQTDHPQLWRVPYIIGQNIEANRNKQRSATIISGMLEADPTKCVEIIDYSQLIQQRHESKD